MGVNEEDRALVSTKGHFVDERTYKITEIHYHLGRSRDVLVYLGLLSVIAFWARDMGWHHVASFRRRIEPVFRYGSRP